MKTTGSSHEPTSFSQRTPRWLMAIVVLAPVLYLGYSFLPGIGAWWSIIDDHRKIHVLTVENGMPISAAFRHFWNAVDFGPLGRATRVQPIFHVLWGLELHFFGLNAHLWYLSRFICALVFIGCTALAFCRQIGALGALILSFAVAIPGFYVQVFMRLGVAESYLAAALAVAVLVGSRPEPARRGPRLALAFTYFFALLIGFGSKEVALIFVPAVVIRGWLDWRHAGWQSPRLWAGIAGLAFATFVLICIYLGLRGQATDIYGQDLSFAKRLAAIAGSEFMRPLLRYAFAVSLLAPLGPLVLRRWLPRSQPALRTLTGLAVAAVVVAAAYVGSIVFYNATIPSGSHYEFPTYPLAQLIVFLGASSLLVLLSFPIEFSYVRPAAYALAALAVLGFTLKTHPSPRQLRRGTEAIREQTTRFETHFMALVGEAKAHPDRPVEFVSHGLIDFEPVHSLRRFLRGYGVTNPVILNLGPVKQLAPQSHWEEYLRGLMLGIAPSPDGFAEVTDRHPDRETIKAFFSRPELADGAVANFWPM